MTTFKYRNKREVIKQMFPQNLQPYIENNDDTTYSKYSMAADLREDVTLLTSEDPVTRTFCVTTNDPELFIP